MESITQISEHIHRLTLPYKDIFTTVYTVCTPEGVLLFDAASFPEDTQQRILPFLQKIGIDPARIRYIFISHNHKDHSGSLDALMEAMPQAVVLSRSEKLKERLGEKVFSLEDGASVLDVLRVVAIPGHTADSAGILDTRTDTLISGDSLQSYGICGSGEWASNINFPAEHICALKKLRNLPIRQLLTAHNYEPYGYRADGEEQVAAYLDSCLVPLAKIQQLLLSAPEKADEELAASFNCDPDKPKIAARVIAAMRKAMEENAVELL